MPYPYFAEIPPEKKNDVVLASGEVNIELAQSIAGAIDIELADIEFKRHPNGELYNRFEDSVREKDVYVIQSHAGANGLSVEEAISQHYYLVSAASDGAARRITVIAPYLGHSRGDRKSQGREVVPAPLVIENFENAGRKSQFRMMSLDLHAPQTAQHLRTGAYEHLTAHPDLRRAVKEEIGKEAIKDCVTVAPDAGAMKMNNRHAEELTREEKIDVPAIFMGKERMEGSDGVSRTQQKLGGIDGKICLTFDDMIDGGSTVVSAAKILKDSGASKVYVAATHAIFSGDATEKLLDSDIDKVFVTDTVPIEKAKSEMGNRLEVVRVGPLIGAAIYQLVIGGSISKIFRQQNFS